MKGIRSLLLYVILLPGVHQGFSQNIDWSKGIQWKMYEFSSDKGDPISLKAIQSSVSMVLNQDTVGYYMQHTSAIPSELSNNAAWMGDHFASCRLGDTILYVRLSRYGGFFMNLSDGKYYEIPVELRADWIGYLNACFRRLQSSH